MAKYLLLCSWLVILKTSSRCGLPIFLKVNHRLESRMQEICQSGSEGGAKRTFVPTPINLGYDKFEVLACRPIETNALDPYGQNHRDQRRNNGKSRQKTAGRNE